MKALEPIGAARQAKRMYANRIHSMQYSAADVAATHGASSWCRLCAGLVPLFALLASIPALASNLVTGNGFGFAVTEPNSAAITRFYTHPYSFMRPDPVNALSEGVPTPELIKTLRWGAGTSREATAEYENDSQVIHMHSDAGEGYAYMPFSLRMPALIVEWGPAAGADAGQGWQVEWSHRVLSRLAVPRMGSGAMHLRFEGVEESLLLIPIGARQGCAAGGEQLLCGNRAWALVAVERPDELDAAIREFRAWRGDTDAAGLRLREIREVEQWRVHPPVHFANERERHLWRQSEVMLRIAQCREENRPGRYGNGLIVASLPDGAWFTPWVRDMAWATVALARMGHRAEARAAVLAYFNARPTGKMRAETNGADYQISVVRYFGDGAEEPFFTEEGATNIEFDDWGEALWALDEYLKQYDDAELLRTVTHRGSVYASARDFVVKPLVANLEAYGGGEIVKMDTSIWEEHQKDQKHFAFSTAAAIVGLRSFAEMAQRAGDEAGRDETLRHVALLEKGFAAAFIRGGKLHGTLEEGVKNDIDGALLAIINLGVVKDRAVIDDVLERMELLKVASGGYRRVRGTYTDPAIYEYWYEQEEFVFVDLSRAELQWRLGQKAAADAAFERVVDKAAADHNIIPEMYVAVPCKLFPGKIGDPTGALPMVGYGAGAYILEMMEREEIAAGA